MKRTGRKIRRHELINATVAWTPSSVETQTQKGGVRIAMQNGDWEVLASIQQLGEIHGNPQTNKKKE